MFSQGDRIRKSFTPLSLVCHPYVTCMYSYVMRMSLVCTCMSFVCHSYVLVCHSYVTRMYSYVIHMSLLCTRMSFVCHLYLLVCHSYVTRMYLYVIRMSLVCGFAINRNEIDKFLLFCFCIVQIVYFECFGSLGFKKFLFFNIGSWRTLFKKCLVKCVDIIRYVFVVSYLFFFDNKFTPYSYVIGNVIINSL